jgi:hypothetical protein
LLDTINCSSNHNIRNFLPSGIIASGRNTINYKISGSIELADDSRIIFPDNRESNLFITITRRERNGRVKIIRNQERLAYNGDISNAEDLPPYSRAFMPSVKGEFRVKSADYGIFIGIASNPSVKIQVVHYLSSISSNRYVRSNTSPCFLSSS